MFYLVSSENHQNVEKEDDMSEILCVFDVVKSKMFFVDCTNAVFRVQCKILGYYDTRIIGY